MNTNHLARHGTRSQNCILRLFCQLRRQHMRPTHEPYYSTARERKWSTPFHLINIYHSTAKQPKKNSIWSSFKMLHLRGKFHTCGIILHRQLHNNSDTPLTINNHRQNCETVAIHPWYICGGSKTHGGQSSDTKKSGTNWNSSGTQQINGGHKITILT